MDELNCFYGILRIRRDAPFVAHLAKGRGGGDEAHVVSGCDRRVHRGRVPCRSPDAAFFAYFVVAVWAL